MKMLLPSVRRLKLLLMLLLNCMEPDIAAEDDIPTASSSDPRLSDPHSELNAGTCNSEARSEGMPARERLALHSWSS